MYFVYLQISHRCVLCCVLLLSNINPYPRVPSQPISGPFVELPLLFGAYTMLFLNEGYQTGLMGIR